MWPMPDYGVTTAILNIIDISRRLCKLNFGPLQGHVKSCHFRQETRGGNIFTFYTNFLEKLARKDWDNPFGK